MTYGRAMNNKMAQLSSLMALASLALLVSAGLLYPMTLLLSSQLSSPHASPQTHELLIAYNKPAEKNESKVPYQKQTLPHLKLSPVKTLKKEQKKAVKIAQVTEAEVADEPMVLPEPIQHKPHDTQTLPQASPSPADPAQINEGNKPKNKRTTAKTINTKHKLIPVNKIEPRYPKKARRRGIEGEVLLEFYVTAQGQVEKVMVITAQPTGYFEKSAIKALKNWTYAASGKNHNKKQQITMQFRLR